MQIDELNAKYGTPGRIVFKTGHCGRPEAALTELKPGESAELAMAVQSVMES